MPGWPTSSTIPATTPTPSTSSPYGTGASRCWVASSALCCSPFRIRKEHLSLWKVMDAAAPAMALGVFIGRTGDLIIGDHLGKLTTFFLGYRCPPLNVATGSPCAPTAFASRTVGAVVHQTALYDQSLALLLFLVLVVLRRKIRYDGFLILVFAIGYGLARILEDFLRDDVRRFGLTGSQWTAIATVCVCTYTLGVLRRTPRWGRWDTEPVAGPGDDGDVADHPPSGHDGDVGPP